MEQQTTDKPTLFKVLKGGTSYNGGKTAYHLPTQKKDGTWKPGKWMPALKGDIVCRSNGYHLTTEPFNWYQLGADIYEAEGAGESDTDGGDKTAFRRVRLLRPVPAPQWIIDAQNFIATIPNTPWFKNDGDPCPEWKLYPNRAAARAAAWDAAGDAAWDAARDAAWDAAGDAAWAAARDAARDAAGDAAWAAARDAARDAALYTRIEFICAGLNLEEKHHEHARARWEVWAKGYGLLCDVDGVLYVYEKVV